MSTAVRFRVQLAWVRRVLYRLALNGNGTFAIALRNLGRVTCSKTMAHAHADGCEKVKEAMRMWKGRHCTDGAVVV